MKRTEQDEVDFIQIGNISPASIEETCKHAIGMIDRSMQYLQLTMPPNEKIQQASEDISYELSRLERATDEMLDVIQLQQGSKPVICMVELCSFLRWVEMQRPEIARQSDVTVSTKSTLRECIVWADAHEAGQVFFHLLSNALSACKPCGHIEISLRKGENDYVMTISDDGVGLPNERNWRENRRRFMGGTRLGLVLCEQFCKRAGWTLSLEDLSDKGGHGTLATVRIPLPDAPISPELAVDLCVETDKQFSLHWLHEAEKN